MRGRPGPQDHHNGGPPAKTPYPCLWFDGTAEEAAAFYATLLPDSHVDRVWRSPSGTPSGPAGTVLAVDHTLGGRRFAALNRGVPGCRLHRGRVLRHRMRGPGRGRRGCGTRSPPTVVSPVRVVRIEGPLRAFVAGRTTSARRTPRRFWRGPVQAGDQGHAGDGQDRGHRAEACSRGGIAGNRSGLRSDRRARRGTAMR